MTNAAKMAKKYETGDQVRFQSSRHEKKSSTASAKAFAIFQSSLSTRSKRD